MKLAPSLGEARDRKARRAAIPNDHRRISI
jgi:hypothetical protein